MAFARNLANLRIARNPTNPDGTLAGGGRTVTRRYVPGAAIRASAYNARSFAIRMSPTRSANGRDLYSSPGNLARIPIYQTMHGQFPTLGPREHHDLDARARAFTCRAGLYSGAGGIWAIGGFP